MVWSSSSTESLGCKGAGLTWSFVALTESVMARVLVDEETCPNKSNSTFPTRTADMVCASQAQQRLQSGAPRLKPLTLGELQLQDQPSPGAHVQQRLVGVVPSAVDV